MRLNYAHHIIYKNDRNQYNGIRCRSRKCKADTCLLPEPFSNLLLPRFVCTRRYYKEIYAKTECQNVADVGNSVY